MELSVALRKGFRLKDGVTPLIKRDEFGCQLGAVAKAITANRVYDHAKRYGATHYSHSKSFTSLWWGM